MNEQSHITKDEMAAFTADDLETAAAERVKDHVTECADCAGHLQNIQQFVQDLDNAWNRERLQSMGVAHPSTDEIQAVWLDEAAQYDLEPVKAHMEDCETCRAHLARLEEGFSALVEADPLSRTAWSELVAGKFAAGIEMVVEAASGAYTSAAGMMRDVMTPQARVQLSPAPALAMGRGGHGPETVSWNDALFVTDEMSGEITGSTDPNTGRGIITVVVNKTGAYVASPPIVDIVNETGKTVATQFALDTGDRYTSHFAGLDQGRYLVGIREPGE